MNDAATTPESPPPPDPLAIALSKLEPAPHGFDRDSLMFAAGQASKLWLVGLWRAVALLALFAAVAFAMLYYLTPPKIHVIERPIATPKR